MNDQRSWESYEDVARYFLNKFRQEFGLARVDTKQPIQGNSGTLWEVDAKGICERENSAIMLIECRRYRTKRLNQEAIGAFAYRIIDTRAVGGIIVSPLPLQFGANLVAQANNIVHVQLGPDSTPENFVMSFFNKICVGVTDHVSISDHVIAELRDKDGKLKLKSET